MKPGLDGQLRILVDALDVAYSRCRQAAGAAENVDDTLCQQLLNISGTLGELRYDVVEAIEDREDETNATPATSNLDDPLGGYGKGPGTY